MSYHRWQNYFCPNFDAINNIDLLRDSSHYLDFFSIDYIYGARSKRRRGFVMPFLNILS